MTTIFNKIWFLIKVTFIILSESFIYFVFKNKDKFVANITYKLADVNILYVKIFQAVALNNKLIDEKTNNYLLKYTDNAPYKNEDVDYNTLQKIITDENLHSDNNLKPINSGMISLVFKFLKKETNEEIVIKIKRNNIDEVLKEAVDNLLFFVYLLSYIPIIQQYEIPTTISENIDIIRNQTDFIQEIENMLTIKNNCKRLNYIEIPAVYKNVTEKYNNVIMMQFIKGEKIENLPSEDFYDFSILLHKFVFITLFVNGVTHGDLHSGNILFINNNNSKKIGIIDFGILYKTDKNFNDSIFDFCTEIFTKPSREVAIKVLKNGFFEPHNIVDKISKDDYEILINLVCVFIDDILHKSKEANQVKIYEFLFNLNKYVQEKKLDVYGIRMSNEFIKLQMFFAMYQGIILKLTDDDCMITANKVINELYGSMLTILNPTDN